MVQGSPEHREYLEGRPIGDKRCGGIVEERPPCTSLPEGFHPFTLMGSRDEAPYLTYLRGRGVSERTVGLYRIGYVDAGPLHGRVVVPSFDANGMVNFWSARSIHPHETLRYRLPQASKDIISNEHMVDWSAPIYLVEGIFDEITIGPQAISLYGKFMPQKLALRLVERRPPMVHVCLDSDALAESRTLLKRLVGYDIPCSLVQLGSKDPSDAGLQAVEAAALSSAQVTGSASLVGYRL